MRFANKRRPWARRHWEEFDSFINFFKNWNSISAERESFLSLSSNGGGAPLGTRCERARARSGAEAINLHFPNDTAITHLKYLHADHVGGSSKVSPDKSLALPMLLGKIQAEKLCKSRGKF